MRSAGRKCPHHTQTEKHWPGRGRPPPPVNYRLRANVWWSRMLYYQLLEMKQWSLLLRTAYWFSKTADYFYRQTIPSFLPLQAGRRVTEDPLSPTGRLKGQGSEATHSKEGSAGLGEVLWPPGFSQGRPHTRVVWAHSSGNAVLL